MTNDIKNSNKKNVNNNAKDNVNHNAKNNAIDKINKEDNMAKKNVKFNNKIHVQFLN